jgi:hypothetical protein
MDGDPIGLKIAAGIYYTLVMSRIIRSWLYRASVKIIVWSARVGSP